MTIFLYSSLMYTCTYMIIVKFNNTYVESFLRNYEYDVHTFTLRIDT